MIKSIPFLPFPSPSYSKKKDQPCKQAKQEIIENANPAIAFLFSDAFYLFPIKPSKHTSSESYLIEISLYYHSFIGACNALLCNTYGNLMSSMILFYDRFRLISPHLLLTWSSTQPLSQVMKRAMNLFERLMHSEGKLWKYSAGQKVRTFNAKDFL